MATNSPAPWKQSAGTSLCFAKLAPDTSNFFRQTVLTLSNAAAALLVSEPMVGHFDLPQPSAFFMEQLHNTVVGPSAPTHDLE